MLQLARQLLACASQLFAFKLELAYRAILLLRLDTQLGECLGLGGVLRRQRLVLSRELLDGSEGKLT